MGPAKILKIVGACTDLVLGNSSHVSVNLKGLLEFPVAVGILKCPITTGNDRYLKLFHVQLRPSF